MLFCIIILVWFLELSITTPEPSISDDDFKLHNFAKKDEMAEINAGINAFLGPKAQYTHPPTNYEPTDIGDRELKYMFFLARHGPRHSLNLKRINRLIDILEEAKRRKGLRSYDILNTTLKYKKIEENNLGKLTNNSKTVIEKIATYIYDYHKIIFKNINENHPIYFESSIKERCNDTMYLYRNRFLYLGVDTNGIIIKPSPNCSSISTSLDYMKLRGFEVCKRYQQHHKGRSWSSLIKKVIDKERGNLYEMLLEKLFKSSYVKSMDDIYEPIDLLYHSCAMVNLIEDNSNNDYCRLFSKKLLKLLNYITDMDTYFDKGPQQSLNFGFSCPLLLELLESLKQYKYKFINEKGKFYFGHNESLLPILNFFGFFQDIGKHNERRTFRSSLQYPMAANLMIEIYDDKIHEYIVRFLLNGRELLLIDCDLFCPIKQLIKIIEDEIKNHGMNECKIDDMIKYCDGFECNKDKTRN